MQYGKDMAFCRQYIEAHLNEEIAPRALADMLGYSYYHFCHVFRICHNMPVGEYIRKKRLKKAVEALEKGAQITEIALTFGFDTPSGFSKAFRREFGMSAREYRRNITKGMMNKKKGGAAMHVRYEKKDGFKAVGYSIDPQDGQKVDLPASGAYWFGLDFSSASSEDYARLAKTENGYADQIGLWYRPEEKNGDLSYFFGVVVESFDFVPTGMVTLEMPAAEYAVFTTESADLANDKQAFCNAIKSAWKYIFEEWFAQSDYVYDQDKYAFEFYTDKNGGMDCEQAVADIYIPVKKKN
ncbi:AraC family transcriptional regulator [Heliobacterium gestii]|nr:AraC family transcriptional regulator [Heliomicrobium gestii]